MTQTYEEYVAEWDGLVAEIDRLKKLTKTFADREMVMRKAITHSLLTALGDAVKEGVNNYAMPDGQNLKLTYTLDRSIEPAMISLARQKYEALNWRDVDFDALLRVKYELSKTEWNKLTPEGKSAISVMLTTKAAAPVLVLG